MAARKQRTDALSTYRSMRDFERTPEPAGRVAPRGGHLYTIQKHAATRLHYDLRLELDGVLKSWAVTRGPSFDPKEKRLAVRTEDHPVDYATFEGRIPAGSYGAGSVLLWDRGTWEPVGDPHQGLEKGKLSFVLHGERLVGRWALVRMAARDGEKRENWLMIKERDALAVAGRDPTEEFTTSVASGRDLDAVREAPEATWTDAGRVPEAPRAAAPRKKRHAPLPAFVEPALAKLVDDVPHGDGWLFEVKFDGYRTLASVSGDKVKLWSRSGLDWTEKYGGIARALRELDLDGALLDGEVVSVDEAGRSDFGGLQEALKAGRGGLSYFVFDVLHDGRRDLRSLSQLERKQRLAKLLAGARAPVHYTDHLSSGGAEMLRVLCGKGFEGVIAKRADAPYRSGRLGVWLKIKCARAQEFVVVGWTPSDKTRTFASLALGVHEDGKLVYAGRVGAGFRESDLASIGAKLARHARMRPAVEGVPRAQARKMKWVAPVLVAEVAFAEFTREGSVRHARFVGLRTDKQASDVVRERPAPVERVEAEVTKQERAKKSKRTKSGARAQPAAPREKAAARKKRAAKAPAETSTSRARGGATEVAGVRLTSPDRILFPPAGPTKLDLARYLEAIAPRMLPHVEKRLVSLVRCPEGTGTECFFQRHVGKGMPEWIRGFDLDESDGSVRTYLWLDGTAGLVSAAQVGAIEIHLWGSRIDDVERPDRLVMDLDPDPSVTFDAVKEAAVEMRAALDALGLASWPMVTGGKGVHVVAPLRRTVDFATLKAFTRALAERFAEQDPERYIATMSKARRKGRIFVDYLRNDRTSTAIAPYSVRAREGAPVAMPVTWREFQDLGSSSAFGLDEALARLRRRDPWADYSGTRQSITARALAALGVATR